MPKSQTFKDKLSFYNGWIDDLRHIYNTSDERKKKAKERLTFVESLKAELIPCRMCKGRGYLDTDTICINCEGLGIAL